MRRFWSVFRESLDPLPPRARAEIGSAHRVDGKLDAVLAEIATVNERLDAIVAKDAAAHHQIRDVHAMLTTPWAKDVIPK